MSHSHSFAPFPALSLWILISEEDLVDQAGLASRCFLGVLVVPLAQVDQRPRLEAWAQVLAPGSEELALAVLALAVLAWRGLVLEALLWAKV